MLGIFSPRYGPTILAEGLDFQGALVSQGLLEIHGKVKGSILHKGRLFVGATACCESEITATSVEIAGVVHGDVTAESLRIFSSGRLHGVAKCNHLVIHEGGIYDPMRLREDGEDLLVKPTVEEESAQQREASANTVERTLNKHRCYDKSAGFDQIVTKSGDNLRMEKPCAGSSRPRQPHFHTSF